MVLLDWYDTLCIRHLWNQLADVGHPLQAWHRLRKTWLLTDERFTDRLEILDAQLRNRPDVHGMIGHLATELNACNTEEQVSELSERLVKMDVQPDRAVRRPGRHRVVERGHTRLSGQRSQCSAHAASFQR